jgi:putative intracellular protease/amidase
MSANISVLNPSTPKCILIVASNPAVSGQTGWPIGLWWSELTHSYREFVEHGYKVDIVSPAGGTLVADSWSDPLDASGYSEHDLISLGFMYSPKHNVLIKDTKALTGQQQDSGAAAAQHVVEALGV